MACPLQKDLGLLMHPYGLSRAGLNNGPIFGFSVAPRTVDRRNNNLREQYPGSIQKNFNMHLRYKPLSSELR